MRRLISALVVVLVWCAAASAQTAPGFVLGSQPTAAQWNGYFGGKADTVNGLLTSPTINGGTLNNLSSLTASGPAVIGGTLGVAGAVNTTSPLGYQITGTSVLNLLSNQASPILSPETANAPAPTATYAPAPSVRGYTATAGASTYENMITSNLTILGTVNNHYGQLESTLNLIGTGNMNAELNQEKSYVLVPSGLTVLGGENKELSLENRGAVSLWSLQTIYPLNDATGVITHAIGVNFSPFNFNTTPDTFQAWTAMQCNPVGGSGSGVPINQIQCLYNTDPNAVITNAGHYAARPDSGQPVLSGCGTSPLLDGRASDTAGTITEGTTATGCTLTFNVAFLGEGPNCVVSSPSGSPLTSYTTTLTTLVIVNSSSSGEKFNYLCFGGY